MIQKKSIIFLLFFPLFLFSQNTNDGAEVLKKAFSKLKKLESNLQSYDYTFSQKAINIDSSVVLSKIKFKGILEQDLKRAERTVILIDTVFRTEILPFGKKTLYLENEFHWIIKNIEPISAVGYIMPKFFSTFYSSGMFKDLDFQINAESDSLSYVISTKFKKQSLNVQTDKGYHYAKYYINKQTLDFNRIILFTEKISANGKESAKLYLDVSYSENGRNVYPSKILVIHPKYQLGKEQNYKFYIYDYFNIELIPTNEIDFNNLSILPTDIEMNEINNFKVIPYQREQIDIDFLFRNLKLNE